MNESSRTEPASASKGMAIGCMAFGAYLLAGAVYAFARGRWPWFMPPLLDVFNFVLGLFGDRASGYVGGALLALFGVTAVGLGVALLVRLDRLRKEQSDPVERNVN